MRAFFFNSPRLEIDTRTGKWHKASPSGKLMSDENGKIVIPVYPSDNDRALADGKKVRPQVTNNGDPQPCSR